jgi:hypothetical protein
MEIDEYDNGMITIIVVLLFIDNQILDLAGCDRIRLDEFDVGMHYILVLTIAFILLFISFSITFYKIWEYLTEYMSYLFLSRSKK